MIKYLAVFFVCAATVYGDIHPNTNEGAGEHELVNAVMSTSSQFRPPADTITVVTKLSVFALEKGVGGCLIKMGLYEWNSSTSVWDQVIETENITIAGGAATWYHSATLCDTLTARNYYRIAVGDEAGNEDVYIMYDFGDANLSIHDDSTSLPYLSWDEDDDSKQDKTISVYLTYTKSVFPAPPDAIHSVEGIGVLHSRMGDSRCTGP